jgi:two-component system, NarL family, sensor kinase
VLKLVVSTQEEERKRLAYDLHDSLGQELNAIKMYLDTLDYMDKSEPTYEGIYKECKMMIEQSISNIQSLSYDLMPKSLELANLSYALSELCDKLGKLCIIQHNFDGKKLHLNKNTEIIIYRIFQEFINNSMKHAKGAVIMLSIKKLKDAVQFSLRDNGPGFDITKITHGNGVRNIRSRLGAINAVYHYKGTPGLGTILQFIVDHENN